MPETTPANTPIPSPEVTTSGRPSGGIVVFNYAPDESITLEFFHSHLRHVPFSSRLDNIHFAIYKHINPTFVKNCPKKCLQAHDFQSPPAEPRRALPFCFTVEKVVYESRVYVL